MPQGSDSGLSSINPFAQAPAFKPSDIYRDTTGPRLEELFTNGKSNTAPLKRPKKPCPVNENAFQRKRQWESDSDHDETMNEKRLRFSEQQPSLMDMEFPESSMRSTVGLGPESESESDLDRSEYTFEGIPRSILRGDPRAIEAARTLPPEGEILDPEIGGDWALEPPLCMQRQQVSTPPPQSNRPHKKRKRNKGKQRARSLSVDTTISTLSSLSNSCYSLRFNDWDAPHQPRQMPNSMYVFCVTSICYLCSILLTWSLTVHPPRTTTTVKNVEKEATWFAATPAPERITSSVWFRPWIPTIRRREIGTAPSARSATLSPP